MAFSRGAEITSLLMLLLVGIAGILIIGWIVLSFARYRWYTSANIKRPTGKWKIKSVWKESGRRLLEQEDTQNPGDEPPPRSTHEGEG